MGGLGCPTLRRESGTSTMSKVLIIQVQRGCQALIDRFQVFYFNPVMEVYHVQAIVQFSKVGHG